MQASSLKAMKMKLQKYLHDNETSLSTFVFLHKLYDFTLQADHITMETRTYFRIRPISMLTTVLLYLCHANEGYANWFLSNRLCRDKYENRSDSGWEPVHMAHGPSTAFRALVERLDECKEMREQTEAAVVEFLTDQIKRCPPNRVLNR